LRSDGRAAWCQGVVKTYRTAASEVRALRGVSAEFHRGALTAVVGPSGSGKSSLLRVLCGLDRPTSGSVFVEGAAVHRESGRALRRLRRDTIGYVFQRPSDNFFPYLTVEEHLRRAAMGGQDAEIDAGEVLARLGIAHRSGHLPGELSGGEQQRAAIAQVLVAGAGIVVADEPTAELDETSGRALLDTMARLEVVTFILATHDPTVWRHADDVLGLDHGRVRPRARAKPSEDVALGEEDGWEPPTLPALLQVRDVSKSYRRGDEVVHAVEHATLDVDQGEVVALVGRSGSGKTTLLNLIGGWEEPDRGDIVWAVPPADRIPGWADVAMLPQRLGLVDELNVRANVEYPARLAGRLADVAERVDQLLEDLGLAGLADRFPRETSVGEQQRTALARALALGPRLVLADEPTGHQDEGWGRAVFEALLRQAAEGTTCVVATHDPDAARHCDRVVMMADGRVLDDEAPSG
jgi:putative ABC transport system ATP-binding protein